MKHYAALVFALVVPELFAAESPLQTITFPDGFRMEVIRSEMTSSMMHEKTPSGVGPKLGFASIQHSVGSTHYSGHIKTSGRSFKDGELLSAVWGVKADTSALMLLVRASEGDSSAYSGTQCVVDGERQEVERDGAYFRRLESRKGGSIEELPLRLQVTDGAGDWRDMDGPVIFDSSEGVGVCAAHVFPRRIPELKFRVLRQGQPSQSFALTNPGYQASFPPLQVTSKVPAVQSSDLFEVRLDTLDMRVNRPGRTFRPWFKCETSVIPSFAVQRTTTVYDATGNYYPEGRFMDRITPLPGERLFRFTYRLKKNPEYYPWRESDTEIIAEGKAGLDGAMPRASLTEKGRELGLNKIEFQPSTKKDKPYTSKEPWTFMFTLYGTDDGSPDLDEYYTCLFSDSGSAQKEIRGPSVGTVGRQVRNYDLDYQWLGTLKPGEPFRVGLVKKAFEEFEFVVDLDDEIR